MNLKGWKEWNGIWNLNKWNMEFSMICNVIIGLVNIIILLIIFLIIFIFFNFWVGRISELVLLKLILLVIKMIIFCVVLWFVELSKFLVFFIIVFIIVELVVNCKLLICVLILDWDVVILLLKFDVRLLIWLLKVKMMICVLDVLEILMLFINVDRNVCSCVNWLLFMLLDIFVVIMMFNFLLYKFVGKGKERMN